MKTILYHLMIVVLMILGQSQTKPPTQPVTPPSTQATQELQDSYPLPPDRRMQIRDLQYKIDHNEIEIQKLQVKIEQLKQEQIQWVNDISTIATDFAKIKQVDPALYELDGLGVRLIKKKQQQEKKP